LDVKHRAGGGGKGDNRKEKIKVKNDKLYEERRQENQAKKLKEGEGDGTTEDAGDKLAGIHPSRRAQMGV